MHKLTLSANAISCRAIANLSAGEWRKSRFQPDAVSCSALRHTAALVLLASTAQESEQLTCLNDIS